ncbi:MAG: hypothetical protein GX650_06105, partial [Clostridiales bacterium]|nr:hypothetical protein [Clostridiales bacterium]
DADGNGVCDNLGTAQQYQGGFAKGKGQRGNREMQSKGPRGYVDADGDGVCDNLGTAQRLHNRIGRKGMPGRDKMYGAGQMQPGAGQMQPGGGRMQPSGGRMQPGGGRMQPGGGRMQPGGGRNRR